MRSYPKLSIAFLPSHDNSGKSAKRGSSCNCGPLHSCLHSALHRLTTLCEASWRTRTYVISLVTNLQFFGNPMIVTKCNRLPLSVWWCLGDRFFHAPWCDPSVQIQFHSSLKSSRSCFTCVACNWSLTMFYLNSLFMSSCLFVSPGARGLSPPKNSLASAAVSPPE